MKSSELMKHDVESCGPNDAVVDVARRMRERDIGFIPVCDAAGKPVGTITDRDLAIRVIAEQRDPRTTRAQDIMTRETVTCRPDDDLTQAERLMSQHQKSRILCVEPSGKLTGVISLADIAAADKSPKPAGG
jgi:CBS domain-containing protein